MQPVCLRQMITLPVSVGSHLAPRIGHLSRLNAASTSYNASVDIASIRIASDMRSPGVRMTITNVCERGQGGGLLALLMEEARRCPRLYAVLRSLVACGRPSSGEVCLVI